MLKASLLNLAAAAALLLAPAVAAAQVDTVDPNSAVGDTQGAWEQAPADEAPPAWESVDGGAESATPLDDPAASTPAPAADHAAASQRATDASRGSTIPRKDVFTAAEGVFGRGAAGLGDMIERLLREQGEPNAYITGREAGGAFVAGLRYGSGTLHHQVEGDRPIYWTGPSLGFDFGADANKVFVLVYNLHDAERIFHRYPAAEGHAYIVGGFTASYLRRGDVVLIPVRLGVGARLGVNAGYMRFSQKNRWLPF
jgi:hypothetical protein